MPTSESWCATTDFLRRDPLRVFWKSSRVARAYVLRLNSALLPRPSSFGPRGWSNIETRTRTIPVTVVPPDWKISLKISPRKNRLELPSSLNFLLPFPDTRIDSKIFSFVNGVTERIKLYVDYSSFGGISQVSRGKKKMKRLEIPKENWGTLDIHPIHCRKGQVPKIRRVTGYVLSGIPDSTW